MKSQPTVSTTKRTVWRAGTFAALTIGIVLAPPEAGANGIGENGTWQFETTQDRVNKGAVVDLVARKKGGFYDSFKTTNNNTSYTYVDKQVNCQVSANSSGNGSTNGMSANTSSPFVTNTGSTSANSSGNAATNGVSQAGLPGFAGLNLPSGDPAFASNGSLGNNQSNSGTLNSAVSGSSTSASTGAIAAGGGATHQVLNSAQNNAGSQIATISGSTACNSAFTGK